VQNGKCGGGCRTGNKELHGIGLFQITYAIREAGKQETEIMGPAGANQQNLAQFFSVLLA
jgi:hypothetical protein